MYLCMYEYIMEPCNMYQTSAAHHYLGILFCFGFLLNTKVTQTSYNNYGITIWNYSMELQKYINHVALV